MDMTKVDLVGGLSGAGKTTFISMYCKCLDNKGIETAVIERRAYAAKDGRGFVLHDVLLELLTAMSGRCGRIVVELAPELSVDDIIKVLYRPQIAKSCALGQIIMILRPYTTRQMPYETLYGLLSLMSAAGSIFINRVGDEKDEEIALFKDEIFVMMGTYLGSEAWRRHMEPNISTTAWSKLCSDDLDALLSRQTVLWGRDKRTGINVRELMRITLRPQASYTYEQVFRFLHTLLYDEESTVLRLRGSLKCTAGGSYILDCLGDEKTVGHTVKDIMPILEIIGFNLSRTKAKALLEPQ